MIDFDFRVPLNIRFGRGKEGLIGTETAKLGKKVLIVTGQSSARTGRLRRSKDLLGDAGVEYVVFDRVRENPLTTVVEEGAEVFRSSGCDVILALGGGSSLDAAKGISLLARNGGDINDYVFKRVSGEPAAYPIVAVPTTCGTGSESNGTAVLTNPDTKDKKGLAYDCLVPKCSIVDPALMETMPRSVIGPVTFDALCHSMESFLSPGANMLTESWSVASLGLLSRYIRRINSDIHDEEAVDGVTLASTMVGAAFYVAGLIAPHGMEHPLSGLRNIAHGRGLAALTPIIYDRSFSGAPERFAYVSRMLGGRGAEDCGRTVRTLLGDIGMETRLSDMGFGLDDVPWLTDNCMKCSKKRLDLNPKPLGRDEVRRIYEEAL